MQGGDLPGEYEVKDEPPICGVGGNNSEVEDAESELGSEELQVDASKTIVNASKTIPLTEHRSNPSIEECPLCFLPYPMNGVGSTTYMKCCGKIICSGCVLAMEEEEAKLSKTGSCPFCRKPRLSSYTDEERIQMVQNRVDVGDAVSIFEMGTYHYRGLVGLPVDLEKAEEMFVEAAELGEVKAHHMLGDMYCGHRKEDMQKAMHHYSVAAELGYAPSQNNLGLLELYLGNGSSAMVQFSAAARSGLSVAMENLREGVAIGYITKEECQKLEEEYSRAVEAMDSMHRCSAAEMIGRMTIGT